jgi:ABC-type multidrug transport system ATPase subunit
MNDDTPLEVKNLNFLYPNSHGIHDVSFTLHESEVLCLFGKNGSGKSTLLRVLSTVQRPSSGSFSAFGFDGIRQRNQVRKFLFPVFDENAHFDFTTGKANLDFFLQLYHTDKNNGYQEWCTELDLDLELKTGEYSMGMKRKLYLLEAILAQKAVLLVDEPALGLDSETRDKIFRWMEQQKNDTSSIIFGTNRVEEAKHAQRVLLIEHGKLRELTSLDSLFENMLTVKIHTKEDSFVEYIESVADLPDLVKRYLSFGIPKQIEILGGDDETMWTKEAVEKVERAPHFVQKMIYKMVESYAKEKGYTRITPDVVEEARGRFEKR